MMPNSCPSLHTGWAWLFSSRGDGGREGRISPLVFEIAYLLSTALNLYREAELSLLVQQLANVNCLNE